MSHNATSATFENEESVVPSAENGFESPATTLYAVWKSYVAFTANGYKWTISMGQTSFYNASTLCPSGYRIPTKDELRTLIGASADSVWTSNSTVTNIYSVWEQPHLVWSSNAYGSTGAYDLFFNATGSQAIITATNSASATNGTVVCIKAV